MSAKAKSKKKTVAAKATRVARVVSDSGLPKLNEQQWNMANILGAVLVVAGLAQLINFNEFKGFVDSFRIWTTYVNVAAAIIVIAEIWAGVSLMKVRLNSSFRNIGILLSVVVAGFWFYEVTAAFMSDLMVPNTGFFGKYLVQAAGWWTIVETAFVTLWAVSVVDSFQQANKWSLVRFLKNLGR